MQTAKRNFRCRLECAARAEGLYTLARKPEAGLNFVSGFAVAKKKLF
jgi:hypothetical protein